MTRSIRTTLAVIAAALLSTAAMAQEDIGKEEFESRCAACHGMDARGTGGIIANLFRDTPKNLTLLAKENGGAFPFSEVYQSIDGRREIAGHGSSQMPLWGRYFEDKVRREGIQNPTPMEEQESKLVQGRILSLVYYLQSVQE